MNKKLWWIYLLSMGVYFGQGIESLPSLPLFIYLKNTLHFDPSTIMYIGSITGIAWCTKPLWGFLVDNWLTKTKWILLSVIGSIIISLFFGLSAWLPIGVIILMLSLGSLTTAFRDVANDGIMCEQGKELNECSTIQSVQWIAITVAGMIAGLGGGYIAQHFSYKQAYLWLIPFYLLLLGITLKYKTMASETTKVRTEKLIEIIKSYKVLFQDKKFLIVCLFLALYNFSPSFGIPLSYIELDQFKWSPQFLGILGAIISVFEIAGALIFYRLCKNVDTKKWLYISVFIGAICSLCYLYFTPTSAIIYGIGFAVVNMFVHLIVLAFMANATIKGKEATSFALLCSIKNFSAGTLSGVSGAFLLPIVGLKWLIILSAATSFLAVPLIKKLEIK